MGHKLFISLLIFLSVILVFFGGLVFLNGTYQTQPCYNSGSIWGLFLKVVQTQLRQLRWWPRPSTSSWTSNLSVCANSVSVTPTASPGVFDLSFDWSWDTFTEPGTPTNTPDCPANFKIQVDDNSDFSSPVYDQQAGASNPYSITLSLPGGVYYWRISIYTDRGVFGGYYIWTDWANGPEFNVVPPPGDFTLSLGGSVACNSVPLSWTASSNAEGYKILRGAPRVDISPYQPYTALNFYDTTVSQNTTYIYQIEAYNAAGTNRSNVISVTTPYCPPTINFLANPTSIFQGQSTTLSWTTTYATSCAASGGWSGSKALNGSEVVVPLPPPQVTYTLTCSGPGGSASDSVTINITPLALPNWREIIPR